MRHKGDTQLSSAQHNMGIAAMKSEPASNNETDGLPTPTTPSDIVCCKAIILNAYDI